METTELKDYLILIQAFVNIFAVMVGGIWSYNMFLLRRRKYPKAKIAHDIKITPLQTGQSLLTVFINFENIGEVLIRIDRIEILVSIISPVSLRGMATIEAKSAT